MNNVQIRQAEEACQELKPISKEDIEQLKKDLEDDFEGTIMRSKRTFRSPLIDKLNQNDSQ